MHQIAHPLPLSIEPCQPGHRPTLVETRGTPHGRYNGGFCPPTWHIECVQCQIATAPHISRALAELRWTDPDNPNRVPLSQIGAARARAIPTENAA